MEVRDIYIKRTPASGKPPVINEHRVWDADRFIDAQQREATESQKVPALAFQITVATEQDYRAQKK